jgi:hypothetical protein
MPRANRWTRSVSLFTVVGAAAACASNGDPLTPDGGVVGAGVVYVLRSVAGAPLPAVWIRSESVTITVRADTIRLFSGGRGGRIVVAEYDEAVPSDPRVRRETADLEFARTGDRIELSFACPDLALCVAPPHFLGRVTPEGLVFDHALNYRTPLRYQRVHP